MKCDSGNLQLYLWNELDEDLRQKTEAHLKSCSKCREEFDELNSMYAMVSDNKPEVTLDPDRIWGRIEDKSQVKRSFRVLSGRNLIKVAAVFLIFAAGLTVGRMGRQEIPPLPVKETEIMTRLDNYFQDVQPLVVNLANDVKLDDEERATGLIVDLLNKNRRLQQLMRSKKDPYINDLLCEIEIILMDIGKIAESRRCSINKKSVDYEDVVMKLNMFSVKL